MTYLLVALGGGGGAVLRYLLDRFVQSRHRGPLPWGTCTVNVAGSAVLGALAGPGVGSSWWLLAGVGWCGAFTTWSTLAYETVRLAEIRRPVASIVVLLGSVLAGLGAASAGYALTG